MIRRNLLLPLVYDQGVMMFNKILVPLDGSELAEQALSPALALLLAGAHESQVEPEIVLLRVPVAEKMFVRYPAKYQILPPQHSLEYARQESRQYVADLIERLSRPGIIVREAGSDYESVVEDGVVLAITETACREKVDLIAMSTHGRSGFSRWMLGSVTERVLQRASQPVLVVRTNEPLEHILIPLDGTPLSETAVAPGMAIARRLGCRVTLLRVATLSTLQQASMDEMERVESGFSDLMRDHYSHEVRQYLEDIAQPYRVEGLQVESVAISGPVAPVIVETAEIFGSQIIVMATHGRTGLRRWVQGSITEKVSRTAHCSMLVIHPGGHAGEASHESSQRLPEEESFDVWQKRLAQQAERPLTEVWHREATRKPPL
jgi:nucleotide-binding universal stress UspA family protein